MDYMDPDVNMFYFCWGVYHPNTDVIFDNFRFAGLLLQQHVKSGPILRYVYVNR